MQALPHHYTAAATATAEGAPVISSDALPRLTTAPPAAFDGPGDQWSPEHLLVASVAGCFVLSFRAIARASRFEWRELNCEAEGVLERIERRTVFTQFVVRPTLHVPEGADRAMAQKLLEKAEDTCFVTNSLSAPCRLETEILAI